MLERIISRGAFGAERAALEIAQVVGLLTGGQSRRGTASPEIVRRFGLTVDSCSTRQAVFINALRADGTLAFGPVSDEQLKRIDRPVCLVGKYEQQSAEYVAAWMRRFEVKTLNVVGSPTAMAATQMGWLLLEVATRLGRRASLPMATRCELAVDGRGLHAVRAWPTPRAWTWRGRWVPVPNWATIVRRQGRVDWTRLIDVPDELCQIVYRPGPSFDAPALAAMARYGRPVIDLAKAGRWGIVRLLAEPAAVMGRPVGRHLLRRLARGRQRDLLGAFGFPATESAVRILGRTPHNAGPDLLRRLRPMLFDPDLAAILRRVPEVTSDVVAVLADPVVRRWVKPAFFTDIRGWRHWAEFESDWPADEPIPTATWCRIDQLHAAMLRTGIVPQDRSVASAVEFDALYDRLMSAPDLAGGPPPVVPKGVRGVIEPLTVADLRLEGTTMRHCVVRYRDDLRSGVCLIYRIESNVREGIDRATLMLRPTVDGKRWRATQLCSYANKPVSAATTAMVDAWLEIVSSNRCTSEAA